MTTDELPFAPPPVLIWEMRSELLREVEARRSVYPRLVRSGKLTQGTADRREQILKELIALLDVLETQRWQRPG